MQFKEFAEIVESRFNKMQKNHSLFKVNVTIDDMWDTYLNSFPEGSNPIFRERREHDCQCCKSFIKRLGNVIAITKDLKVISIWDCYTEVDYPYDQVALKMSQLIHSKEIMQPFFSSEKKIGCRFNRADVDGEIVRFHHFFAQIHNKFVLKPDDMGTVLADKISSFQVCQRGLKEINLSACETVLDLIASNNLYRGKEFKKIIVEFMKIKKLYEETSNPLIIWLLYDKWGAHIRNTVIGTLLLDLSNGIPIEEAVTSFEKKVAPDNYKRPKAIVTKGMLKDALKTIKELDLEASLYRRPAMIEDLSINDILFVDVDKKGHLKEGLEQIFDDIAVTFSNNKVVQARKQITMDSFIEYMLPLAKKIEVFVEPKHQSNFMGITTAEYENAPSIFKWDNPFSWCYTGNIADSEIKERVIKAGGRVDTPLRFSLAWWNTDDLDLHFFSDKGEHVYYGNMKGKMCHLDVDANAGGPVTTKPVENIYFNKMNNGKYAIKVKQYRSRNKINKGFSIEIDNNGEVYQLTYDKSPNQNMYITVATFEIKDGKVKNLKFHGDYIIVNQDKWGIKFNEFVPVKIMMLSPNYWESGKQVGNKHFFFLLENCLPDESLRGYFNEFLKPELHKHRKVFEVLAGKMVCEPKPNMLAGLGFSETQPNSIKVKVTSKNTTQLMEVIV